MADKQKVGWIGLGKMGLPMASNVLKAGFPLTVYNRTKAKTKDLAEKGAKVADSPKEAAADAEVIISMIADDPSLEEVSCGPNGAFLAAKPGVIYIDMSTVSPEASARVAKEADKKGLKYLRAPVSGSTGLAAQGTLTILCSGPKEAFDQCQDLFASMGKVSFHVGTGEEARVLKLALNMMVGITAAMLAESLVFGEKGGLDWNQMIDIINNSAVASGITKSKENILKSRNYAPMFTMDQLAKDYDIALEAGKKMNVPMHLTSMIRQYIETMKAQGKGGWDYIGFVPLFEEMAGLKK